MSKQFTFYTLVEFTKASLGYVKGFSKTKVVTII